MQITTGRVVNGQIVVDDDEPLPEGADVVITITDQNDDELTAEQLAELETSIAEADRGELTPADEVLRRLREEW